MLVNRVLGDQLNAFILEGPAEVADSLSNVVSDLHSGFFCSELTCKYRRKFSCRANLCSCDDSETV